MMIQRISYTETLSSFVPFAETMTYNSRLVQKSYAFVCKSAACSDMRWCLRSFGM